jgi:hypothetical protein
VLILILAADWQSVWKTVAGYRMIAIYLLAAADA